MSILAMPNGSSGHTEKVTEALPIVQCGAPILRRPAEPLDPAALRSRSIRRLIEAMRATMDEAPGIGLAAPQIGEPIRLAVLQDGPERWGDAPAEDLAARERTALDFTVLANPVVTVVEQRRASFFEGCLSVPGLAGVVARHRVVRVDALDERGEPRTLTLRGWPARIVQHEVDHLNGVLYVDRVETRSITTTPNLAELWMGRPTSEAAAALGFDLVDGAAS
jgi:peptide deformylase